VVDIVEGTFIGKVKHFYSKISVAVLEPSDVLKAGDTIRIVGNDGTNFTQPVESMEIEHQKIKEAKPGDLIGLKVTQRAHKGCCVYKL